jgi:UDP-2,3-diacylglucosamine pyrophosphatase LpxH
MRTAVISDLHLGGASGEDVLREPALRRLLLAELAGADRVVLLGDTVELRDLPVGVALAAARPFFEELGEALAGREVVLVPGNHDHRFAEPLLDELSLAGSELGLEHIYAPSPGLGAQLDEWLGAAELRFAYPGLWLREDVYVTHGHYMDPHLTLPRAECVAAAVTMRFSGRIPDAATPADYERVLRPIYGLGYAIAQTRRPRFQRGDQPSEAAWKLLSGDDAVASRRQQLAGHAVRASFPAGIRGLNRLLGSSFESDISATSISRSGVTAGAELADRLGFNGGHVITGHTHRAGPEANDGEWPLPGGGQLHNSGNWIFASAFHHPGRPPGPYWPGTVTWIEADAAPRRVRLLAEHSHDEMTELVSRASRQ